MTENVMALLALQAKRYPKMQPADAVKLLYQSAHGAGHMIEDVAKSSARLQAEMLALPKSATPQCLEPLANRMLRIPLTMLRQEHVDDFHALFTASANVTASNDALFDTMLLALREAVINYKFAFTLPELDAYLEEYTALGRPAVSHSETYRLAYTPAYRVIDKTNWGLLQVAARVRNLLRTQPRVLIAIDGNCAAGKSSAAQVLSTLLEAAVVHMDDYFLPLPLRTPERLREPGGNIDTLRFSSEVIAPYLLDAPIQMHAYDCQTATFGATQLLPKCAVTIVEGAYSMHPLFGEVYDVKVVLTLDSDTQLQRILARNGEDALEDFTKKWIPMENHYMQFFGIKHTADIVI